jgi:hypothetical protein
MKKIFFLCFICFSLVALLGVTACAEELPSSDIAEVTLTQAPLPREDAAQASPLGNFLESAGNTLFALVALVGSLLISFLYKSGAISSVRTGLSSLEELLGKSREATEECSSLVQALEERIAALEAAREKSEGGRTEIAAPSDDTCGDPSPQKTQTEEV